MPSSDAFASGFLLLVAMHLLLVATYYSQETTARDSITSVPATVSHSLSAVTCMNMWALVQETHMGMGICVFLCLDQ